MSDWARMSGAFGRPISDAELLEQKRIEAMAMGRADPVEETIRQFLMDWDCGRFDAPPAEGARELMRRLGLRT